MKVRGPYIHKTGRLAGRRYVNIEYEDGKRTSKLFSRHLVEQYLGRNLLPNETVDHVNEDFTDDSLDNLQIISNVENIKKYFRLKRPRQMFLFVCPRCGKDSSKPLNKVLHNRKQGKAGPYCSKSCAARARV